MQEADVAKPNSENDDSMSIPNIELPPIGFEDVPDSESGSFLSDESTKLYTNSSLTTIKAITILLSWFSSFPGISKSAFSRLLFILGRFILPENNTLPKSYTDAVKMIKGLMVPTVEYHCCVNDCLLYRDGSQGNYAKLTECPKCGENRYTSTNTPRKTFKYIPLEQRLKR